MCIRTCWTCLMFVAMTICSVSIFAETVVLAVPGPGSLSYLPVYLAKAIAADQSEGLELKLRYVHGGPVALRDLIDRNCDFASVGLAAIAASRADGSPVVAIGQLSQSAMYVFLLRSDLKSTVHTISQLKGKRIGVTTGTSSTRSMGHMVTEYLLKRAGLKSSDVQFVSTGQNRDTQSAALKSGTVDALMGDEPFASELLEQGVAIRLADLYLPSKSNELLGGPVVHASLVTREDVLVKYPETVKKILRMYDKTLQWMAQHTAQEIMEKLSHQPGFNSGQKNKSMSDILQRNQGMYTRHVNWDQDAIVTTERFFHASAVEPEETRLKFSDFVRNPGN